MKQSFEILYKKRFENFKDVMKDRLEHNDGNYFIAKYKNARFEWKKLSVYDDEIIHSDDVAFFKDLVVLPSCGFKHNIPIHEGYTVLKDLEDLK